MSKEEDIRFAIEQYRQDVANRNALPEVKIYYPPKKGSNFVARVAFRDGSTYRVFNGRAYREIK